MPLSPKVAIVILNWNGVKFLRDFLPSVLATNYPALEVVVADNDSKDDSIQVLEKEFPEVRIIKNKKNLGFAGGYNEALKQVDAEYYAILNSDVEVTPNWIWNLVGHMEKDKSVAVSQPIIRWHSMKSHFEYAGAAGGFIDKFGFPFCRGRIFEIVESDNEQYNTDKEIFWATGACMLIRSEVFHEMNGFDDDFFAHMEEIDLCWRIKNAGYKVYCYHDSVVYHVGGGTLPVDNPRKTYLNFRNSLVAMLKNLPPYKGLFYIPLRFFFDLAAYLKFLKDGDFRHAFALNKAHFNFLLYLPKWFGKRRKNRALVKKERPTCVYKNSIVLDHFARNKNLFSDLDQQRFT